jgi:hypothetical protein
MSQKTPFFIATFVKTSNLNIFLLCTLWQTWDGHSDDYWEYSLLECDTVGSGRHTPTYRMYVPITSHSSTSQKTTILNKTIILGIVHLQFLKWRSSRYVTIIRQGSYSLGSVKMSLSLLMAPEVVWGGQGLISLWHYKENTKPLDWKNVFNLNIPPELSGI